MKKQFTIVLFLLVALMAKAQMPNLDYKPTSIDFDITDIALYDQRVYFLYNLVNDSRFEVTIGEENGVFVVSASDAYSDLDLEASFNELRLQADSQFRTMDKGQASAVALEMKAQLPKEMMLHTLIDRYIESRDNSHCIDAYPFCTDNGLYDFPAGVDAGSGESGPDYDCLYTTPNPAWYYMLIDQPGDIDIYMYSTPRVDIDFCCWGPFTDPITPCPNGLTENKVVSCSYSTAATEHCLVPRTAQTGEFYILIITNYSNDPCNISFEKVAGDGTTDCGILPPLVNNDGPFCAGETIHLSAVGQGGATYSWTGPNGFTSTEQNPVLQNATVAMSGTYICTITVGTEHNDASTEVIVYANPVPVISVNPEVTHYGFTAQLSVNAGPGDFEYHWEPADMVVNPTAANTQTVTMLTSQQFTVTVVNPEGSCSGTAEVTVNVEGSPLTATASADNYVLCQGTNTTLHAHPANGTEQYTFSWTGPDGYSSTQQNPSVTPPVGDNTYTCHISDGITAEDIDVNIVVHPNEATEFSTAICETDVYNFYEWGDLNEAGDYDAHLHTIYGCDSIVTLHLSINYTYTDEYDLPDSLSCNSYFWDSKGKTIADYTYNGHNIDIHQETINASGTYVRRYLDTFGCDSIITLNAQFEYTPSLSDIIPTDSVTSHWVIPATEFQINSYKFSVYEHNRECHWDSVTWHCTDKQGNEVWNLTPSIDPQNFSHTLYCCELFVLEHVDDTLTLTATAYNSCEPEGVSQEFWLVCSFYDLDEQATVKASFNVLPNPNNGDMNLSFDNLTGKVAIKVYDMNGNLIDSFETYNETSRSAMTYSMRSRTPGIYYFVATAKEGTVTKKVVVTP